ncbi:hypothetical protein Dxin01_03709 [Deinococcus xinjiangensis]|uniref:DUF3224 domain-containing protein n=1 Tax=Deinococcus xinjiangensis TaxID=457454 RepID=A0ABP9VFC8_9DEIO
MTHTAKGTFQIKMWPHAPAEQSSPELGRMSFDKVWAGDLSGSSKGEMLSVGDPKSGTAAYTVLEVFKGSLDGRGGSFAFHQYGTLISGQSALLYQIVPASGGGELAGITGELKLDVIEGVHHYALSYELP